MHFLRIVNTVKESLRERLTEVDWMSEETRTEALRKMDNFRVKIGFPVRCVYICILDRIEFKPVFVAQ